RERSLEPAEIAPERRRKLPEERAELRRAEQRLDPLVEELQVLTGVDEALDVRDVPAHLHGEQEVGRRLLHPAGDGVAAGEAVEGRVDLDGVELAGVEAKPVPRRAARRIEDAVPPVGVVPAGTAYARSAFTRRRHSSSFPAAATRERPSRSSGAAPN